MPDKFTKKNVGGRPKKAIEYAVSEITIPQVHDEPGGDVMLHMAGEQLSAAGADGWRIHSTILLPRETTFYGEGITAKTFVVLVLWQKQ